MDLLEIKGRIAVALVESIFRRAGFALAPVVQPDTSPRQGREDLIPDFQATPASTAGAVEPARVVEVRYRSQVGQYLLIESQRGPHSLFAVARRQWPDLVFVFVTDHPEPGRSCFQVVDLGGGWSAGSAVAAGDLHAHATLRIFRQNVEEHEALLRRMFALLTGA